MTSRDFVFWLDGFLKGAEAGRLDRRQVREIKAKLKLVSDEPAKEPAKAKITVTPRPLAKVGADGSVAESARERFERELMRARARVEERQAEEPAKIGSAEVVERRGGGPGNPVVIVRT